MADLLKELNRRQMGMIGSGTLALLAVVLLTYVVQPAFKEFRGARGSEQAEAVWPTLSNSANREC